MLIQSGTFDLESFWIQGFTLQGQNHVFSAVSHTVFSLVVFFFLHFCIQRRYGLEYCRQEAILYIIAHTFFNYFVKTTSKLYLTTKYQAVPVDQPFLLLICASSEDVLLTFFSHICAHRMVIFESSSPSA